MGFHQDIGGTADCMKIIIQGKKGCGQIYSNNTYFSDMWFSGFKTVEEENTEGVDYGRM